MAVHVGALGYFGDARRAAAGDALLDWVMSTGSLVISKLGVDRAGEMSFHRFLSAPSVDRAEMLETLSARTVAACAGRHVVVAQDTTEINFSGRDANRRGLGPGGDGTSDGFFIHAVIAIDVETGAVLGLLDAQIWARDDEIETASRRERVFEDKESIRWLRGAERAAELLVDAASIHTVADRESDIYGCFVRRPPATRMIVRAAQDRNLADGTRLFDALAGRPELARTEVKVASRGPGDRPGDPGRVATLSLRAGPVVVNRPRNGFARDDPKSASLTMVEAREVGVPPDGKPLIWRLLTSVDVTDAEGACEIARLYRMRWRIEEVFRALKSDGMRLEETQLHQAARLFKLAVVGLAAATRTIQLVDARDGGPRPATDVIDASLLPAAEAIGPTLERRTTRQQNPHPIRSLAWLAWILARLGGWNCYYKPPGPKTMRDGWATFAKMAAGFAIARAGPATPKQNV